MKISYDPECDRLARWFLDDEAPPGTEDEIQDLAGAIQTAIEDWLDARNEHLRAIGKEPEDYSGQGEDG